MKGLNQIESSEENERRHNILSIAKAFGKNVLDPDLFPLLVEAKGILITHDLKMMTRANEFALLKELGLTTFIISLPANVKYSVKAQAIINRWFEIKKIFQQHNHEMPFICRLTTGGYKFI